MDINSINNGCVGHTGFALICKFESYYLSVMLVMIKNIYVKKYTLFFFFYCDSLVCFS